jgi:two-component system, sensor histidine kinase
MGVQTTICLNLPEELIANIKALIRLSHAEKEIREINRRKDVFLATLAHELRNPLGPIKNSIKLLQKINPANDSKTIDLLDVISRQTDQMTRLVDDLLDVSRISQGKISLQNERVSANEFLTAAVESSARFIEERGHSIDVEISPKPLWIFGDKVRLVQIISNLLNNAAKFTPRGSVIRIKAYEHNDHLTIDVTDEGIGLTESQLESIFDLFVQHGRTEDRAHEGLGIGLSLVKNLTELHDAEIKAFSSGLKQGSTFTVNFKLASPPPETSVEVNLSNSKLHLSKILVIDDNIDAANTLAELLILIGHEVKTANNGIKGIETAFEFEPDVVFLDIGLPDMFG